MILVLALLVFGPKKLPEVSRQVGEAMRELRKVQHTVKGEIHKAMQGDSFDAAKYDAERAARYARREGFY